MQLQYPEGAAAPVDLMGDNWDHYSRGHVKNADAKTLRSLHYNYFVLSATVVGVLAILGGIAYAYL
jgi:hypothetical protein